MEMFNSLLTENPSISDIDASRKQTTQQILQGENNLQSIECSKYKRPKLTNSSSNITEQIQSIEQEFIIKDTPAYYLNLFLDSNVISWLLNVVSSNNKHMKNARPISESEIRCFIAIIYLSGYIDVPRRRMLWERAPDTHCSLVSNAMQRDRFELIFTALSTVENLTDEQSKLLSLKPLIDQLNENFLQNSPEDDEHSVAVCYITCNKKFHNKKITSKLLNVWCGCTKSGYCVWFEPALLEKYDQIDSNLCGKHVIVNYARLLHRTRFSNYRVNFESCLNDISVTSELQKLGIEALPVDRETSGFTLNPSLIGVDRMDCNVNLYRSAIRGKKSYQALITYAFDVALQNAWQLYKFSGVDNKPLDLLGFRRNVVIYYLQHYGRALVNHKGGRPPKINTKGKRPVPSDARFDGIRHYVIPQPKQTRCAKCTSKTTTRCQKCDVGLHVKCFLDYHQQPRL